MGKDATKTKNDKSNSDPNEILGIDVSGFKSGSIVVVLPNNSQVTIDSLDIETNAEDIIRHLQAISTDTRLRIAKIDGDKTHAEKQVRVITLKTNAQEKGYDRGNYS